MKKLVISLLCFFSVNAFATVDSNTNVFILVQHIQSGEYFVQKAPIIGCYGLAKGPELAQLTKPYIVNNLGCGMDGVENINVLICASVVSAVEADDFSTFKKITLDVSKCDEKNNKDFDEMVRKVVRMNFSTKAHPNPELILID